MASAMTEIGEILKDIQDDLAVTRTVVDGLIEDNERHVAQVKALITEVDRLTFENGALRERLRLSEEENYSDDLADARRDRERDQEFSRSEDFQARGER